MSLKKNPGNLDVPNAAGVKFSGREMMGASCCPH